MTSSPIFDAIVGIKPKHTILRALKGRGFRQVEAFDRVVLLSSTEERLKQLQELQSTLARHDD